VALHLGKDESLQIWSQLIGTITEMSIAVIGIYKILSGKYDVNSLPTVNSSEE